MCKYGRSFKFITLFMAKYSAFNGMNFKLIIGMLRIIVLFSLMPNNLGLLTFLRGKNPSILSLKIDQQSEMSSSIK